MAQTGTTFTLQSSSYQGRYLKLTCTSSQDIANNKTNISWKLESIGGSSGHYATIVRVNINGSEVYSIDKGYTYDAFPVTKGSTTGSTSVTMGSDGNKSITIYMDAAIYTSSTTRYSDTWTLNTVPRYPTISSFSVNKISGSSTSLSFVWSASAPGGNISKLEYSTDNGSTFKTASSVTSPLTVSGLASAQGYNCKIRVTSSASGLTATTTTPVYQTTYQQPTANISTANISGYNGLSQIKVSWSSNMDIAKVEYSRDNGSTWYNAGDPNASSGNYTYTGLTEGQSYNFKVRVTATTGSCVTTSGTSSLTTRKRVSGNLYINGTKVGTSNGQTGIALKNGDTLEIKDITNNASCGYKLFFENPDNQHQYLSAKTTGTTAISMTAEQIRQRLQYMTTVNSQGYNVGITTLNGSDQPALYYEFFGTLSVANSNPDFSLNNWAYQDTNATTVALTGSNQILVNGFSKLRVNIGTAAGGVNYATISQYAVSGCTSGSSTTTGNIDCATATNGGTITVTARDSRGNTTPTTRTATFKNYAIPTMASISATRSNGGVGTVTTLTFNGTWWNANFGASANTLSASYRYKSGSTWSSSRAISLTTSGNNYSFNDTIYGDLAADGFTLGTTFTIEVTITDALNGGKQWTTTLSSGTPAIAISGSNIAVGSQYDTNKGGKIQINNGNLGAVNVTSDDLAFKQTHTSTGKAIGFGVGGGGTNRGCWDFVQSKWLWYDNDSRLFLNKFTSIPGAAADQPLRVRGIVGSNAEGTAVDELHLGYGSDYATKFGKTASTYIQSSGMLRGAQAGSWVKDRDNSLVRNAYNGNGAYAPVICQGTKTGSWTVGCLSGEDSLTFNFETDTKYNNNTNTAQRYTIDTSGYFSGTCGGASWSSYPYGFSSRATGQTWGSQTGTFLTGWQDSTGGSIAFRRDNPTGGQMSMIIDGTVYVNEGRARCYGAKNLYYNGSGTNGNITLNETAANFEFIDVFFIDSHNRVQCARSYAPNGRTILLYSNSPFAKSQTCMADVGARKFNGTAFNLADDEYGTWNSWNNSWSRNNNIKVISVVGWR